jgi:hypothetical protein
MPLSLTEGEEKNKRNGKSVYGYTASSRNKKKIQNGNCNLQQP